MQKKRKLFIGLSVIFCMLVLLFLFLFSFDNKYRTPPPYGQNGVLSLTESDFSRKTPIYLIDGWLFSDGATQNKTTYIGEYSNLQHGDRTKNAHGEAIYQITLQYSGTPQIVVIDFPELFTDYTIWADNTMLADGRGSTRVSFPLRRGNTLLTVRTVSTSGYYSGMYFPAALGTDRTILRIERIKTLIYAIAFLGPLVLAIFTLCLWSGKRDYITFWFGLLCCFYALYLSYYFVQLLELPFAQFWYYIEDISLYGLIFCMVQLTKGAAGLRRERFFCAAVPVAVAIPIILLLLHALIPFASRAVILHGRLKNLYFVLVFFWLLAVSIRCIHTRRSEYAYILAGNLVFGIGLLLNLLGSNLFEPIYTLWQFEWCGLLLVGLFGSMMVARNRRILRENDRLTLHLESMVEQRTEELSSVLQERSAFFSDMAHDLKAPLFATKTFIEAIRAHSTNVDSELQYYLTQVDRKQQEMAKRVQSLNTINRLDHIKIPKQTLSVRDLLTEVHATHNAEAEVSAIHLVVSPPEPDCLIYAQQEKLLIVFENLIYNALRITPPDGSITISAKCVRKSVQISVTDTGCGIPEEELPLIFKRFYVGEQNKAVGSGLGLYIVKTVMHELGGSVSVSSQVGKGTCFTLKFPQFDCDSIQKQ